jgi:LDH2 family malate/lactate/ureidoglycolate dehydrogenase
VPDSAFGSSELFPESCFDPRALRDFVRDVFLRLGCSQQNASQAADVLLASDLRGIESHGVARLEVYEEWLRDGHAPANPEVKIIRETAATATVDGGGGLGIMVAPIANRIAIDKAEQSGAAWISVRRSNHFGIAGYYVSQAVERQMIGWVMSNASAQVAPTRGLDPMFGTNPFAVGVPAGKYPPIIMDMATTAVAYGKVEIARRRKRKLPVGWAIDGAGNPVTDPELVRAPHRFSLLPLGSDELHGVHKGYCLASVTDLLAGVLSDAAWGPFCPYFNLPGTSPTPKFGSGLGHLFSAMRIDAFDEIAAFTGRVEAWVEMVKACEPIRKEQPVMVPGEPEFMAQQQCQRTGIPLIEPVIQVLKGVALRNQVDFPEPVIAADS